MRLPALLLAAALAHLALAGPVLLAAGSSAPLTGAEVEVEKLDGTRLRLRVGPDGTIVVSEVPLGVLKLRVLSWKGVPVNYECTVTPSNASVRVPNIYRLVVRVVGSRGQGLPNAAVRVLYGGAEVERGSTDESGTYKTLLPAASFTVVAEYGGREARQPIELRGPSTEVTLQLDVFAVIGGTPISPGEFMLLILVAALIPLALFVAAYEYSQWRRKRALRVIAPPERPGG